jgi:peptide/nickel transport system permease protein
MSASAAGGGKAARPARRARRGPRGLALAGAIIVAFVVLAAAAAPLLAPGGVADGPLEARLRPPGARYEDTRFLLGSDSLGRDLLDQIVWGSRVSLLVGALSVAIGGTAGFAIGLLSAYRGGWMDALLMRVADVQLALPSFLLALAMLAMLGPGLFNLILVLAVGEWVTYARVARGQTLAALEEEYLHAAKAMGAGPARICVRHIVPNVLSPVIVIASFSVARVIIAESSLSFLGLGLPPDTPTWGALLARGRDYMREAWWVATFPGLALLATVLGINTIGDWLRDRWDPRSLP